MDKTQSKCADLHLLKFSNLCRLCGEENTPLVSIYGVEGRDNDIASKINLHFPISVSENDQLPLQLCYQCVSTLSQFHTLYEACAKTDAALRDLLQREIGCDVQYVEEQPFGYATLENTTSQSVIEGEDHGSIHSAEKTRTFDLSTDGFSMSEEEQAMDADHALDPVVVIEEIRGGGGGGNFSRSSEEGDIKRRDRTLRALQRFTKEQLMLFFQKMTGRVVDAQLHAGENKADISRSGDEAPSSSFEKEENNWEEDSHDIIMEDDSSDEKYDLPKNKSNSRRNSDTTSDEEWREKKLEKVRKLPTKKKKKVTKKAGKKNKSEGGAIPKKRGPKPKIKPDAPPKVKKRRIIPECQFCLEILPNFQQLLMHFNEKHLELLPLRCDYCTLRFDRYSRLKTHMETAHPHALKIASDVQRCPICDIEFRSAPYFKKHVDKHYNRYECTMCRVVLPSKEALKMHTTEEHSKHFRYLCGECGKQFMDQCRLSLHQNRVHKPKPQCEICGSRISSSHMKDHMMTHTGEKPYVCEYCGMGFIQRGDYSKHKLGHGKQKADGNVGANVVESANAIASDGAPPREQMVTIEENGVGLNHYIYY